MKKRFVILTTVSQSLPFFRGQINILKQEFEVHLVSSPGHILDDMASVHEVHGHSVPMRREANLFHDIISLFKLIILFRRIRPHIIHGNTPKGGLLSMLAAWILRVPKRIYYVHGLRYQGFTGIKRRILMSMERISCKLATHIISVSNGIKEAIESDEISTKQVQVIWKGSVNGIDTNYFDPDIVNYYEQRATLGISNDDFIFGFIGRLVGDKGINELIESFKAISRKHTKAKLLLIGEYEEMLDSLSASSLKEIETNPKILKVGYIADVRPYLRLMDVFVFPSYREGLGIVLLEAGAMNIPVICSDILGCNEIIFDRVNGFLVPCKQQYELQKMMEYTLVNPQILSSMAVRTREMVISKFSQPRVWAECLKTYTLISKEKS